MLPDNSENFTPMMQQYLSVKKDYEDCILFYRIGDFYEMFFDDALTASKILDITLTGKDCGMEERAPMCGVPFHAVEPYINKLVKEGFRVAICEQVEDPKQAKGIVKREVIRIVTPGTNIDTGSLDDTKNNFLMGIVDDGKTFGLSLADVSTGEFLVTEVENPRDVLNEISKFEPSEIVCPPEVKSSELFENELFRKLNIAITPVEKRYYDYDGAAEVLKKHFRVAVLDGLGVAEMPNGVRAAGMVLSYLYEMQKNDLSNILTLKPYFVNKYMIIDSNTRRNLELTETLRDKERRGSLLWVLDKTKTAMGARLLRIFVEQPLVDKKEIEERLSAIEDFNSDIITREEIREYLNPIYDIERLLSKICYRTANPRDLKAFHDSLSMLPAIKRELSGFKSKLLQETAAGLDALSDLYDETGRAIVDDPPLSVREGGMIKDGYSEEVDRLRHASTDGKKWIAELEATEKEKTGIKNLKIKYNRVFGYYFEVSNSYKDKVPTEWTRKQTLANAERYINPELKKLEDTILGAEEKLVGLEYDLFTQLRDKIAAESARITRTASSIAMADVFAALSAVAEAQNFVRPQINTDGIIDIKNGRHPVVEKIIGDGFIANDTFLDNDDNRISIITGPNMAGKSTYMRQTALITILAQMGSFVPADSANIGICDRIFTRVGASDDLASGQSTFMVEMTEVANILRNATRNSLLILDEIGRGTSTFDGLAIAWAVVEYIGNKKLLGAKTLFATHYHELTELEGKLSGVHNYCIAVQENGEDIIFLRKIMKGGADKSYGIEVARLAGVPEAVIERARDISMRLTSNDILEKAKKIDVHEIGKPLVKGAGGDIDVNNTNVIQFLTDVGGELNKKEIKKIEKEAAVADGGQISFFANSANQDIIEELLDMDLKNMSPIDALNRLFAMQKKVKNRYVNN